MPSRARKPVAIRSGARRASSERDAFDGPDDNASVTAPSPAAPIAGPGDERQPVDERDRLAVDYDPGVKGIEREQRTVNFDKEVLDRAKAATVYLGAYEPESGISNFSDLINRAVVTKVLELEAQYNDGKPFRRVHRMPLGRTRR